MEYITAYVMADAIHLPLALIRIQGKYMVDWRKVPSFVSVGGVTTYKVRQRSRCMPERVGGGPGSGVDYAPVI